MGTGDDFAKSEGRYKEFIDSGLPLAKAFAECWEHMRTETGALLALSLSGRPPLQLPLVERRAPNPLLTATWRVPRTHGTRLAGTYTAVPRPSCDLEAGHHRGSWR